MKFTTEPETLNLIPIGDIRFDYKEKSRKRYGTIIWVAEVHILCETDKKISKETEKALLKEMTLKGSELLTDGRSFYTTRGTVVTEVRHSKFNNLLEENKEEIDKLLYG